MKFGIFFALNLVSQNDPYNLEKASFFINNSVILLPTGDS